MADESNIFALAEAQKRQRQGNPADDSRPAVHLDQSNLPRAIDAAEKILLGRDKNIYQFGHLLVTVVWDRIRVSSGGEERALRLAALTVPAMLERFDRAVQFKKWSITQHGYVPTDCPKGLAERYLARIGEWKAPTLLGVVTAPTLRADGSILDTPGYDPMSGLLFDPLGVVFPPVPAAPTEADAAAALARLKDPLKHFAFVDEASRAVALSGVLSAVARRAVDTVPMHCIDAPVAGSGKSKIMDYAAVILTGHRAAVIAADKDDIRNALAAAMLAGSELIALDNMERDIGGELLNQILTQSSVVIRLFHTLSSRTVPCGTIVFATGNNIAIAGDVTRRALVARLEPAVERPELLQFDFDPVNVASQQRPNLVVDALTVLRAWLTLDDHAEMPPPLGSFEQWSRLVREALIWLGEADPVAVMEEVRGTDPVLAEMRQMMTAWLRVFGPTRLLTIQQIMAAAKTEEELPEGVTTKPNQDLLNAISAVAADKDWSRGLAWWLKHRKGRIITLPGSGQFRFTLDNTMAQPRWMLDDIDGAVPAALTDDEITNEFPF
jgi:putative DNA primase/helicase